ncbi:MAG: hypothetical protein IPO78_16360 [Saprospiraceae bacterium]|nr:hypothetical protein [Saprospiraceae bacterium]
MKNFISNLLPGIAGGALVLGSFYGIIPIRPIPSPIAVIHIKLMKQFLLL